MTKVQRRTSRENERQDVIRQLQELNVFECPAGDRLETLEHRYLIGLLAVEKAVRS